MSYLDPDPEMLAICEELVRDVEIGIEMLVDNTGEYQFAAPQLSTRGHVDLGERAIKNACETLIGYVIDTPLVSVESEVTLNKWDLQVEFTFTLITGLKTEAVRKHCTSCESITGGRPTKVAMHILHGALGAALSTERWLAGQMFHADKRASACDAMNFLYGNVLNIGTC